MSDLSWLYQAITIVVTNLLELPTRITGFLAGNFIDY